MKALCLFSVLASEKRSMMIRFYDSIFFSFPFMQMQMQMQIQMPFMMTILFFSPFFCDVVNDCDVDMV